VRAGSAPYPGPAADQTVSELQRRVEKLVKINAALMQRVERSMDQQANAFSLFQTAISLEAQVRVRTEELKSALNRLERANDDLTGARDAAERANRFKTTFFTAVGHDLLQPLHAARLSLSAMTENETDPQHMRLTEQIDHALSTIEELLRTILDLSKLESGVAKPSLMSVALGELFQSLAVNFEPMARNKNVRLTIRASDALVTSDPLMLRRILQNLLANAVHYTERGEILLAARRRGDPVRIEVWDTGPGIDPDEQERIFEEFHRGSASELSRGGGFGMGLSITRRMADALGHGIELCSRKGCGSRFAVLAPFAGRAAGSGMPSRQNAEVRQAYGFPAARIVVVDNDEAVLEAMRTLLDRWGCAARFALGLSDVESLIAREPSFRPDVVLADYHLEHGGSGLAAVGRLRAVWGAGLPAIVISADYSPELTKEASQAACEILRKPVKPAELRALMMHLLG